MTGAPAAEALRHAQEKMRAAGISESAVAVFSRHHRELASGATGVIGEEEIAPVTELPHLKRVEVDAAEGGRALADTVMVRLNGGLATSMGLTHAKSLLPVEGGRSFLDLIAAQVLHARRRTGARLPLVLLNSFRTRDDSLAALRRHPELAVPGVPADVVQNRVPKLREDTLEPVAWPADPSLEWCPPGHGDLFPTLYDTGLVDLLIDAGFRRIFCANADNLGATPDPRVAGWFAASGAPYAAEVCSRTPADRKGGHLARRRSDGQLILRETAQTSDQDMRWFTDETVHPYAHANNIWIDLHALRDLLAAAGGDLGLPLIRNRKTVDPTDPGSTPVIQAESAVGAAVGAFEGAQALVVGRDRFVPVKSTNDLLLLRSDAYAVGEDGVPRAQVSPAPFVDLDPAHYRMFADFEARFPNGAPSLREATSLVVRGDWTFGAGVTVRGSVRLEDEGAPRTVPSGAVLG